MQNLLNNLAINWYVDKHVYLLYALLTLAFGFVVVTMLRDAKRENWLRAGRIFASLVLLLVLTLDTNALFNSHHQRILQGFETVKYEQGQVLFTFKPAETTTEQLCGATIQVEKTPADTLTLSLSQAQRLEAWAQAHPTKVSRTALDKLTLAAAR